MFECWTFFAAASGRIPFRVIHFSHFNANLATDSERGSTTFSQQKLCEITREIFKIFFSEILNTSYTIALW